MSVETFPDDLLIRVASYLPLRDAIRFQNSSGRLRRVIRLRKKVLLVHDFSEPGGYRDGNHIHLKMTFPPSIFDGLFLHTVQLSFLYVDQGWGHRKGRVHVTEIDSLEDIGIGGGIGRIIASSPIAKHHETRHELVFQPKRNLHYGLCYIAGGGGGHRLDVRDIKLSIFVHERDNADP